MSAHHEVLLGSASARQLYDLSFADVLNEDSRTGYQRRFSAAHSLDFRRYIQRPGSATIPLTFNLRPRTDGAWTIQPGPGGTVALQIAADAGKVLSQVDCQHRLGHMGDLETVLPFMIFVGLSPHEELEVFNVINSKAKGLGGSLLDYQHARLATDLGRERPELLVALHLHEHPDSPWHRQLDLGGTTTSGLARRASLRTMQKAIRRFLTVTNILGAGVPVEEVARMVLDYWTAVRTVLADQWAQPRRHMLTKGVGVYALMGLLADAWTEIAAPVSDVDRRRLEAYLADFAPSFDWSNRGPLQGLGGEGGASRAVELLRAARAASHSHMTRTRPVRHGGHRG